MIRWLKSIFAWRRVEIGGSRIWSYWENSVTGDRKACREHAPVMSPLNWNWLRGGRRWIIVDVNGVRKGEGCAS